MKARRAAPVACSPGRLLALFLTLLAGCDLPGRPDPAERPVPEDRILSFRALFGLNCAGCHGADGKFGPAPPLNDPLFRALVPEKELEHVITAGRGENLMPAFPRRKDGPLTTPRVRGSLTAAQVQVLVYEIKGIPYRIVENEGNPEVVRDPGGQTPVWGIPAQAPKGAPPYKAARGAGTGDAGRGARLFATACAGCHGADGSGGMLNPDGPDLTIHDRAFLSLLSDQALRRFIITGRRDLGMPDYAGKAGRSKDFRPLSSKDVDDLVALLASWRSETKGD
jgi:cytochrome c oxidase cbb3-type subunit 3/ubiquinol-cytochrome c reductase cytochrome c subunit